MKAKKDIQSASSILLSRIEANDDWLLHCMVLHREDNTKNGEFARKARLHLEVSLRAFAKRMSISAVFLSDLERGRRNWTKALAKKWEKAARGEERGE